MILSVIFQTKIFLTAICIGILIGLFYDLIKIFRDFLLHNRLFIDIEDTIFWIISAVVVFFISLYQNNGEIRAFFVFGISLGILLYFFIASRFFLKYSKIFIRFMIKYISLFIKITLTPIILVLKLFRPPIKYFYKKIKTFFSKRSKIFITLYVKIKNKVKFTKKSIYNKKSKNT